MAFKTSNTDLVIVGAGPAGLMAAAWASRLNLNARVLDDKAERVQHGRADGLHVRTMEILDSFGLATPIMEKAYKVQEINSWNPVPQDESRIQRTQRVRSQEEELGRFPQVALHQGFIEQTFLDFLAREGRIVVERNIQTDSLDLNHTDDYPITLNIRNGDGEKEEIKTKYLIGSDGGHSWTRSHFDLEMRGDKTKQHFGVIDVIPITDFQYPAQSIPATPAASLSIPREDRLVRFYVQLAETGSEGDKFDPADVNPQMICEKASSILHPYTLKYEHCDWWSVYTVGRQFATKFDIDERIFFAGDAVHTHSPTLGAGMNVSIQDTYNLVWKLGHVIKGSATPALLSTYNFERQAVAAELIDMDRKMSSYFSRGPGTDSRDYSKFRDRFRTFLSGVGVQYESNMLICLDKTTQSLASGMIVGQRIPSFLVVSQAEAIVTHFHELLKSDGRWRILLFAGTIKHPFQMARFTKSCEFIQNSPFLCSLVSSVLDILTLHAASRSDIELLDLPGITHVFDEKLGYDYWKCFANNGGPEGYFEDAYQRWGIDKDKGCIAAIRPDQHVAYLGELDDTKSLEQFLLGIFCQPKLRRSSEIR